MDKRHLHAMVSQGTAHESPHPLTGTGATLTCTFTLIGLPIKGTLPVNCADRSVDPDTLTASKAAETADVRQVETGLIFATKALKFASVMDAAAFPMARFKSTRVILGPGGRNSNGAAIEGQLTLRDITRLVRLYARPIRPKGMDPDDLQALIMALATRIDRHSFDASEYPEQIDPIVTIDIDAEIRAAA